MKDEDYEAMVEAAQMMPEEWLKKRGLDGQDLYRTARELEGRNPVTSRASFFCTGFQVGYELALKHAEDRYDEENDEVGDG